MNEFDPELFEAELRKLRPARPPADLMARLAEAQPATWDQAPAVVEPPPRASISQPSALDPQPLWTLLLRWLGPAAAAAALLAALLVALPHSKRPNEPAKVAGVPKKTASNTGEVEIDRQLVALFDAVAQLPSGQPVRFRCRQWDDEVVFRDPKTGVEIERRTPRLEVVPVSLEVY